MSWQRTLSQVFLVVTPVALLAGCAEESASLPVARPDAAVQTDAGASPQDAAADTPSDAASESDAATSVPAADYAAKENWLCRPDHNDACQTDLTTTIVRADGTLEVEAFVADADPAIDCFYVYPTVSQDSTPNSDLVVGPEETGVVRAQFARFAAHCRLFAPVYRQFTLTALSASLSGGAAVGDRVLAYRDVLAAWRHYLANDNNGRGVVLIGHSQGAGMLSRLIAAEIDPAPAQTPFVGALLLGTNVLVPEGGSAGGTFQNVPVCRTAEELGCVLTYSSFRTTMPPPASALFSVSRTPGLEAACANPAAPAGGPAELHAYLSTSAAGFAMAAPPPWVSGGDPAKDVTTPFVSVPGLLSGECVYGTQGSYLAVTVKADPADPRVDDIVGDVSFGGQVQADWGLHLIDVNIAMGNLLNVVKAKADAFRATRP